MTAINEHDFLELQSNDNVIRYRVRRHPRARRISIKVSNHRGVELVLPMRASLKKAIGFMHEKCDWVSAQLMRLPDKRQFTPDAPIVLLGRSYSLNYQPDLSCMPRMNENRIEIGGAEDLVHENVKLYLKRLAKEQFTPVVHRMALALDKKVSAVSVRELKSRWGSCSTDGRISLCWRLMLAPQEVAEYVIAHEVAHLKVMDHSKRFWQTLESIYPDYRAQRLWLKRHGQILQTYE